MELLIYIHLYDDFFTEISSPPRVSFRIFGKGGQMQGWREPLAWPPEHFEISDAQRSHFMPSELNHVWVKYLVVNGIYSNTLCTKPLHVWSIRKT